MTHMALPTPLLQDASSVLVPINVQFQTVDVQTLPSMPSSAVSSRERELRQDSDLPSSSHLRPPFSSADAIWVIPLLRERKLGSMQTEWARHATHTIGAPVCLGRHAKTQTADRR